MAHRVDPRALADLDDIWCYVAKQSGSIGAANRLIDSITVRFCLLANILIWAALGMTILVLARVVFPLANM